MECAAESGQRGKFWANRDGGFVELPNKQNEFSTFSFLSFRFWGERSLPAPLPTYLASIVHTSSSARRLHGPNVIYPHGYNTDKQPVRCQLIRNKSQQQNSCIWLKQGIGWQRELLALFFSCQGRCLSVLCPCG